MNIEKQLKAVKLFWGWYNTEKDNLKDKTNGYMMDIYSDFLKSYNNLKNKGMGCSNIKDYTSIDEWISDMRKLIYKSDGYESIINNTRGIFVERINVDTSSKRINNLKEDKATISNKNPIVPIRTNIVDLLHECIIECIGLNYNHKSIEELNEQLENAFANFLIKKGMSIDNIQQLKFNIKE